MMIIALDTGNRCIKTAHAEPFTAGLVPHGISKPFIATDTLFYKGNYYSFSQTQGIKREDKSVDDFYFILTLAGIAREIITKKIEGPAYPGKITDFNSMVKHLSSTGTPVVEDIYLSVGLPPRDMVDRDSSTKDGKTMRQRYKEYFTKDGNNIKFTYNDIEFDITIKDVFVSAQGFAAIFPNNIFNQVAKAPQAYIIDIGGYTTDIAYIVNRKIDLSYFESLDFGVIFLYSEIADEIRRKFGKVITGNLIEAVLQDKSIGDVEIEKAVKEAAKAYATKIVSALKDRIDLELSLPVLIGGGVQLLKEPLIQAIGRKDILVIPDVRANAIGYETFAKRILRERGINAN